MLAFVLGFYLVHDHVHKYDVTSKESLYQVEEYIVPVGMIFDKFTPNIRS